MKKICINFLIVLFYLLLLFGSAWVFFVSCITIYKLLTEYGYSATDLLSRLTEPGAYLGFILFYSLALYGFLWRLLPTIKKRGLFQGTRYYFSSGYKDFKKRWKKEKVFILLISIFFLILLLSIGTTLLQYF